MWQQINSNKRKTVFVLFFMSIFLALFACALSFLISKDPFTILVINIVFYGIFIGMFIYGYKKPLSSFGYNIYKYNGEGDKTLLNVVSEMKIASGLTKMPEIYILDSEILNAFACGTNEKNAKVVVSRGLLETLNRDELQGVIGHEIAHIVNRDICYLLFASIIVNIVTNVSNIYLRSFTSRRSSRSSSQADAILLVIGLIFMILAPILATMFYFLLSRKREYLADACSAQFTRNPEGLANALNKISDETLKSTQSSAYKELNNLSSPLAQASYIIPLKSASAGDSLFSTHPNTKNRIKILLNMAGISRADFDAYNSAYKNVTNKDSLIKLSANERKKVSTINPANLQPSAMGIAAVSGETNKENIKQESIKQEIKNHRNIEDLMWSLAHYINIDCSCGTKLRVPPSYNGKTITCPHCKKQHTVAE